jgi:small-conductance mechanosensitive channel
VELELLCWIGAPVLRGRGTHEILKSVHAALGRADVEIPFPQRDLHVRTTGDSTTSALAGDRRGEADAALD